MPPPRPGAMTAAAPAPAPAGPMNSAAPTFVPGQAFVPQATAAAFVPTAAPPAGGGYSAYAQGPARQASLASQSARMDALAAGSHDAIVDPFRLSGTIPGAAQGGAVSSIQYVEPEPQMEEMGTDIPTGKAVFCARPGHGGLGRRVQMMANFMHVHVNTELSVFHYDVQVRRFHQPFLSPRQFS